MTNQTVKLWKVGFLAVAAVAAIAPFAAQAAVCDGIADRHVDSQTGVVFCMIQTSWANMCYSNANSQVMTQTVGIENHSQYNGYLRKAGFTDPVAGCGATSYFPNASGFSSQGGNIPAGGEGTVTFTFNAGQHEQCGRVQLDASFRGDGYGDMDTDGWNILGRVVNFETNCGVTPPPSVPTADIKANGSDGPITIAYNTAANLSWSSQNATACTVIPGGYTGVSGSHSTGNLTASQIYRVDCTGPGGSASDSVTVNVGTAPQCNLQISKSVDRWSANPGDPINFTVNFSTGGFAECGNQVVIKDQLDSDLNYVSETHTNNVDPAIYDAGSRTLTWNVHPVDAAMQGSITIHATVANSGNSCGGNNSITNFARISKDNSSWINSNSVNTSVNCQNITADIKANGSDGSITVNYNDSATISWTSSGAASCNVQPDGWTGVSGSQSSGSLTNSRTYVLTCSNGGQTKTDSVTVNVNSPNEPTVTITANPSTINQGNSSVLTWTSQNAVSCFASGGWSGSQSINGSQTVSPQYTTTYTITCQNSIGHQASSQATVTVVTVQQTPSLTMYANPTVIYRGQGSNLIWNSQNTVSCQATGGGGNWINSKNLNGSEMVYPQYTTTYTMQCQGTNGTTVYGQATVVVNDQQQQLPPTVTLYANPSTINQGQSSVLNWYSNNANSCSATGGWSGNKNLNGSETVSPTYTTTYTVTCVNNYGVASDSKTVIVNGYVNPGTTNLTVTKTARNITLNQSGYSNFIEAEGLDVLEFEIRVRNNNYNYNSGYNYDNVIVRDILPQELFYTSNSTTLDGGAQGDGITAGGINIGSLNPGQERVIRFRAVVFYGTAQKTITNQAMATSNSGNSQSGFATITIKNRGQVLGAADVTTGPEDGALPWAVGLGLITAMAIQIFFLNKKASVAAPIANLAMAGLAAPETAQVRVSVQEGNRRQLDKLINDIRAREDRPDTDGMFQA